MTLASIEWWRQLTEAVQQPDPGSFGAAARQEWQRLWATVQRPFARQFLGTGR
jgi:hypothetical protein